eukprot:6199195-Pleurochrysis_carterae.AAC.2
MVIRSSPPTTANSTLRALLLTYSTMLATRLCFDGVATWIVTRSHDGPIVHGRSAYSFARQTVVTSLTIDRLTRLRGKQW